MWNQGQGHLHLGDQLKIQRSFIHPPSPPLLFVYHLAYQGTIFKFDISPDTIPCMQSHRQTALRVSKKCYQRKIYPWTCRLQSISILELFAEITVKKEVCFQFLQPNLVKCKKKLFSSDSKFEYNIYPKSIFITICYTFYIV